MADRNIINQILERAEDENFKDDYAPIALRWYRRYISTRYKNINRHNIRNSPNVRQVVRPIRGSMYTFRYVPKGRDTLPYYDSWPLIIPFKRFSGGKIHAFNLHYMPPKLRLKTLIHLSPLILSSEFAEDRQTGGQENPDYFDDNFLNIRWFHTDRGFLRALKKCTRTYLKSHIKGKLIEFPTQTWPVVVFLPIARWRKEKNPRYIWEDIGF